MANGSESPRFDTLPPKETALVELMEPMNVPTLLIDTAGPPLIGVIDEVLPPLKGNDCASAPVGDVL